MIRWIRKLFMEVSGLAWTMGGTGLVLITLSGSTRSVGVWISISSFALHMLGWLVDAVNGEDE
jgi:hypothetical protein